MMVIKCLVNLFSEVFYGEFGICHVHNCHRSILDLLSDGLSVFDLLCKRSLVLLFVRSCLFSENSLLKFVPHNAVFHDRMRSTKGRTVQLCCERFSLRLSNVTGSMFSVRAIDNLSNLSSEKVDDNMNRTVEFIIELVKDTRQYIAYLK